MSMIVTRSPLEPIGMNGAGVQQSKRRSARLSEEGREDNEPLVKKSKVGGAQTTSVSTKETDGGAAVGTRKKRKVYEEKEDDFSFSRSKKAKPSAKPAVRNSTSDQTSPAKKPPPPEPASAPTPAPAHATEPEPKPTQKKQRRRLPTTPEREKPTRRSKRLSSENEQAQQTQQASPHKPAHAKSHARQERSPSPFNARPVTIEKKRKKGTDGVEEEKIMRIQLPFADTPVIKRNKEMRKSSAEGHRRSSSGMRGKRASSLIDEGRGNGELSTILSEPLSQMDSLLPRSHTLPTRSTLSNGAQPIVEATVRTSGPTTPPTSDDIRSRSPYSVRFQNALQNMFANEPIFYDSALPHSEVASAEFFKHISAELTEPRRMRCLLGWCGTRALLPKPEAPKDSTPASSAEFQAQQAARVIQEELASDLVTKGILSDWFSRDDDVPPVAPLQKRPNPRNIANAAKAEELERELERLKKGRASWDELLASAATTAPSPSKSDKPEDGHLSPLNPDLLDTPQRAILEQLQAPTAEQPSPKDPTTIQHRLQQISQNLEFTVDQFAHGVHALSTTKATADRLAERSLDEAASVLQEREQEQRAKGQGVGALDALRGLARVLNRPQR
ncbi:uncharacterized protein LTR77_005040 [Saxophila tyrrhenica]|uniref:Uncharacterized protein n=1 Tax=Saxophila tyrrhenica TaxID=1690608 RepID=A0AAV9PE90_9PEZI|nr:hypothetical protein LTR77_005040 [Saxophila tyrrhenica]